MDDKRSFDLAALESALTELGRRACCVKGWLSSRDSDADVKSLFKTYPSEEQPGLRVFVAKPEYIFAMKCRAMRVGGVGSSSDIDDIKLLARAIGIKNSNEALALVEKFYPQNLLEPKTRLGLEEIFSSLATKIADDDSVLSRKP